MNSSSASSDKGLFTPVPQQGLLQISGIDTERFLQGQLTCDVSALSPNQHLLGLYCNLQGRLIASFRIFNWDSNTYLSMPRDMVPIMKTKLAKYAIFSKVTMTDVSDHFYSLGLISPSLLNDYPIKDQDNFFANDALCILKLAHDCYQVWGKETDIESFKTNSLSDYVETKIADYHLKLLKRELIDIIPSTSEKYLPQALGFEEKGAISFTKGCYLGQEIIARMHYKAKRKQFCEHALLTMISDQHTLESGLVLFHEGNPIIDVIDCVSIKENQYYAIVCCQTASKAYQDVTTDDGARVNIVWCTPAAPA